MKQQVIIFEQIFRCKGNYCLHLLKGKIIELIRGNDDKVRRVKLNVYQTKPRKTVVINRPLQLIVPFEIASESPEPARTRRNDSTFKSPRDAAKASDTFRRMITS